MMKLTRTEEREQAFILLFDKSFNVDTDMDEIISFAVESRLIELSNFAENLAKLTCENLEEIDSIIENHSIGWRIKRLPRVSLSILRLAICEIKYVDSIPNSVSVNEAVELAKKYASTDDASFINGILGTYIRGIE
ncbi:MAG: transcription antitermination factor NusB [Oscillospiraceae bacterium]